MRLKRSIAIQQQLTTNIGDLFSRARSYGLSSSEMSTRLSAMFERYPKLPRHVKEYVRGYYFALWNNLYRTDLIHGYMWKGLLFSKWDEMPEELKEHIRSNPTDKLECGHYWKHFADKQEYKLF